jgi:hypothetical protein
MVIDGGFSIPLTSSQADVDAAERAMVFGIGWLADPLFFGDFPQVSGDGGRAKNGVMGTRQC